MQTKFKLHATLAKCPVCKETPLLGYACGDFFIFCAEECPVPMCDHPSEEATVKEWNEWADKYRKPERIKISEGE